ncbi:transposase [Paenibacillus profundus]|uniref:Transposase n=1 Tax=Paenibacillus profundus TaxID=1173085 RepID=A0ABS8YBS6_9BACL|nr:transposase [Paenibacillus profundus]MCE5169468.1 transposase [Paenibacillus profundus]
MNGWQSIDKLEDLQHHYPSESSCVPFLFELKWPQGFVCPRCRHTGVYIIRTRRLPLYECRACHHQTSLTAGTVMEGSRTPLRKWLTAFWLVSRSDTGINAVQLSSVLKVTYKTAWSILHKIRIAISRDDSNRSLNASVQGIVTFLGRSFRPTSNTLSLHPQECPLIVSTSATPDEENIVLKMKLVNRKDMSGKLLLRSGCDNFIAHHVSESVPEVSIIRQDFRVKRSSRLYRAFSQARRWLNDTFHGLGEKHLQLYLDEYCFRHNASAHHESAWGRLLDLCMSTDTGSVTRYCSTPNPSHHAPYRRAV